MIYKFHWRVFCPFCKWFCEDECKHFSYGSLGEHIIEKHKGRLERINLKTNSRGKVLNKN